jgi:hypothetical protein
VISVAGTAAAPQMATRSDDTSCRAPSRSSSSSRRWKSVGGPARMLIRSREISVISASGVNALIGIIVARRSTQAMSPAFSPKPWLNGAITG